MSKIPDSIIEKIRAEMKGSYKQGVVREELGMIPHEWRPFAHGASFGYSLSLERIAELEKEVEGYKKVVELKEGERKQWADMCIQKQSQIEGMRKDTEMWLRREVGLEELVYKAFFCKKIGLSKEQAANLWDKFKKENDFKPLNH